MLKNAWLPHQKLVAQCGGAGGVLDSLLDIIGQCTPSTDAGKGNATIAEGVGCGRADASNIRSNCCSLVSLLVALLASAKSGSKKGLGNSNDNPEPQNHHGTNSSLPEQSEITATSEEIGLIQDEKRTSLLPYIASHGWVGRFVNMRPAPSPDIVETTRKKGWAARQALARPVSVLGAARAFKRPVQRKKPRNLLITSIMRDRKAERRTVSSLRKRDGRDHWGTWEPQQQNAPNSKATVRGSAYDNARIDTAKNTPLLAPIQASGSFASPPRISRMRERGVTASFGSPPAQSKSNRSPIRIDHGDDTPLGLSSPELGGKRKRNTKARICPK